MSKLLGRKAGVISGVRATGAMVIVEMLSENETLHTSLIASNKVSKDSPQGYILDIGPALKGEEWGIKVGDRVILQGSFVPIPTVKGMNGRELGAVDAHTIKGVLLEEE